MGSLWLGVAIHYARDARAHRFHSMAACNPRATPSEEKKYNALKRLWWCCIICDRIMALTLRRNVKITPSSVNLSDCPTLCSADLADEIHNSSVYDATSKLFLADIVSKLAELCVILADVLFVTSSVREGSLAASPRKGSDGNLPSICRLELQRWYTTYLEMKLTTNARAADEQGGISSSVNSMILFANLVEMYYQYDPSYALSIYDADPFTQLGQAGAFSL